MKIRIVSWNINQAAYTRKNLWNYFHKLDFDVGLFQEVYMIPYAIRKNFHFMRGEMNAILLKKTFNLKKEKKIILNKLEIDEIADFYVSAKIELGGKSLVFISIYNFMGPNENEFSKFLDSVFSYIKNNRNQITIIGGDLNMNAKFKGNLKSWGLIAIKMKKELYQLGYNEVLSTKYGPKAFTFITTTNKKPYQLDYLFIPENIKIHKIMISNKKEIFNQKPRLSDHLPIITEIQI